MVNIERIECGNANCYLVYENDSAILVDTSRTKYRDKILKACEKKNVNLIVLTHGHVDHIQNAAYLSKKLNAPIALNKADYELSKDNIKETLSAHGVLGKMVLALSIKSFREDVIEPFEPKVFLKEGDSLETYGIQGVVVELPGHTKGSIGLLIGKTDIIVGDALMNMFYPTKSMLYGDRNMMEQSARRISNYKDTTVYFGHGKSVKNRNW